jgi:membrane protein
LTLWTARSAVSALRLIHRIAWDQDELPKINQFVAPLVFSVFMLVALVGTIASERLRATGVVLSAMGWIAVISASFALVAFGMSLLPRAGRPWPVVLPGAVLFTVVVRGMVIASQVYFAGKLDRVDDLYGSLGIAIVVLVWLYLLAWGWIAATFLNAGLQGVTGGRPGAEPHPAAESIRSE